MSRPKKLTEIEQKVAGAFLVCPHCQSTLCTSQDLGNGVEAMFCMHCGFTTSNLMIDGSTSEKTISSGYPRLYKDLRFRDVHGYVWYPATINVPGVGMVYVDGTSVEDWEWASTPQRKLTRREKRSGRFGDEEYISIPTMTRHFGKDGFIQAMNSLGLFGSEDEN